MRLPVIAIATLALASAIAILSRAAHGQKEATTRERTSQSLPGAQSLPDAPAPNVESTPVPAAIPPKVSIWHQKWDYDTHHISNREVLASKAYWAFVGTDVLVSSFDAEMSHQGNSRTHGGNPSHPCLEGGEGLAAHPTRWQLYKHNLPENATVIVLGFVETKIKMPHWLMFTADIAPVQAHLRAGLKWYQNCW